MNQGKANIIKLRKMCVRSAGSTDSMIYFAEGQDLFEAYWNADGEIVLNKKTQENYNETISPKRIFLRFFLEAIFAFVLSASFTFILFLIMPAKVFYSFVCVIVFFSTLSAIIITRMLLEFHRTNISSRSKHSAEHMMANFIEKNNRLPRNLEDFYSSSRFSEFCGSKNLIYGLPEWIISGVLASVIAIIAYLGFLKDNCIETKEIIILQILFIGLLLYFFVVHLTTEFFYRLTQPLEIWLNFLIQLANTTPKKHVNDNDIILAFCAASEWQKNIYPEYYNKKSVIAFLNNFPDEDS